MIDCIGRLSWLEILTQWFSLCFIDIFVWEIWHVDRVDGFILIEDSDAMISSVFHWYIRLKHWHAGLLMIDLIVSISTLTLILSWLFWSLHMHTLTTVYHSTWHADPLVGILFWSFLSVLSLYHYPSDRHILAYLVWTWVIYLYSAWLYGAWLLSFVCLRAACLCGLHIYPLISHPLVSVTSFITVLTFASVRPYVCLYSDRDRG